MEHHCDLSQRRMAYRCGDDGGAAPNEKKLPRRPVSDADKGADTRTPPGLPAISTPRVEKDNDQLPSADGEIWPHGAPDTD
jgi:hypothetical protein